MKVLSTEDCQPPAIGLMFDAAGLVAAFVAHGQAGGKDCGKIDQRWEIIDRHTVWAFVRRHGDFPPRGIG